MNPFYDYVTVPALILLLTPLARFVKGDVTCRVDATKCVCEASNFTINLGVAFPEGYVNISGSANNKGDSFVLSPCKNFNCGGKPSRVCQWDASSDNFHVIGTAEVIEWSVESVSKFIVTFRNGDPTFNGNVRAGTISCLADASQAEPKYSFDGEGNPNTDNPLVYSFTVTAKSFTPVPGSDNVAGIADFELIVLVMLALILGLLLLGIALLLIIMKRACSALNERALNPQHKYQQLFTFVRPFD